jgi:hypothetical protein
MLFLTPLSVIITLLLVVSRASLSDIFQLHFSVAFLSSISQFHFSVAFLSGISQLYLSVISLSYISQLYLSVTSLSYIYHITLFLFIRLLLAFFTSLLASCRSLVAPRTSFSYFSHIYQLLLVLILVSSSSSFTCFSNLCQSFLEHLSVAFNSIICFLYFFYLLSANI